MFLLLLAASCPAVEHWDVQYFYDENKSALAITDLKFPSDRRGVASGYISEKEKIKPVVLVSSDGGAHWVLEEVKEAGISLFFLDDSLGWMVTTKGIWQTEESGRNWHKLKAPKNILKVWFSSRQRGWAIGERKSVFETNDGGAIWKPLDIAAKPAGNPEYTTYGCISFAGTKSGVISGWNTPPRRMNPYPDWMDPEKVRTRRQWPTLSIFLQTADGGETWHSSTASLFGRLTRMSFAPNFGLGLMEFNDDFEWPSEVYKVEPKGGKSTSAFRQKNRAITDVYAGVNGPSFLAGFEPVGTIRQNPIPGRLKILKSDDLEHWREMPVDYRAEAHRAVIAASPGGSVWVATDLGMILKLTGP
ncbi:MAG: YCF48-related protein [Acidobacteriota bacterium]|nr:YCF48-related protein [Acidobacteriota bacterium]